MNISSSSTSGFQYFNVQNKYNSVKGQNNRNFVPVPVNSKGKFAVSYAPLKLSFGQGTQLSHLPVIDTGNNAQHIASIIEKARQDNAQIVVLSDYDGCIAGFHPDPLQSSPPGGKEAFSKTVHNLDKAGIPFFILTSRTIADFKEPGVISDAAKNTNLIGLKGNQINAVLPFDADRISKFAAKYWPDEEGYERSVKELQDGKTALTVEPKPLEGFSEVKTLAQEKLSPLGFFVEDKKIMYTIHWRALEETAKDKAARGETHEIGVDQKIFSEVSAIDPQQGETNVIIKNNENGSSIKISLDSLIKYGQKKFENICSEKIQDKIEDGKIKLHLDEATKIYEVVDMRTDKNNKGSIVKMFTELFTPNGPVHPIFLGDSVGRSGNTVKDDEHAMQAAADLGGSPIAVTARDTKEIKNGVDDKRKASQTAAKFRLRSFEDNLKVLNKLAEMVH